MLFKLDFGRHSWKVHLIIKTKLPKQKTFLEELQRGWKTTKLSIEREKEAMKKQFDKKRKNPQELKQSNNVWLEAKKYPVKMTLKEVELEILCTFQNHKEDWTRSILTRITRRIGDTQFV